MTIEERLAEARQRLSRQGYLPPEAPHVLRPLPPVGGPGPVPGQLPPAVPQLGGYFEGKRKADIIAGTPRGLATSLHPDQGATLFQNLGREVRDASVHLFPAMWELAKATGRTAVDSDTWQAVVDRDLDALRETELGEIVDGEIKWVRDYYTPGKPLIMGEHEGRKSYLKKGGGTTFKLHEAATSVSDKISAAPLTTVLAGLTATTLSGAAVGGALKVGAKQGISKAVQSKSRATLESISRPVEIKARPVEDARFNKFTKPTSSNPARAALQRGVEAGIKAPGGRAIDTATRAATRNIPAVGEWGFRFSPEARVQRGRARQARQEDAATRRSQLKKFDRAFKKLKPAERVAVFLRASMPVALVRGTRRDTIEHYLSNVVEPNIATVKKELANVKVSKVEARALKGELRDLENMKKLIGEEEGKGALPYIDKVDSDPKYQEAMAEARRLTETGGDLIEAMGLLPRSTLVKRRVLEQAVVFGSRIRGEGEAVHLAEKATKEGEQIAGELGDVPVAPTLDAAGRRQATGQEVRAEEGVPQQELDADPNQMQIGSADDGRPLGDVYSSEPAAAAERIRERTAGQEQTIGRLVERIGELNKRHRTDLTVAPEAARRGVFEHDVALDDAAQLPVELIQRLARESGYHAGQRARATAGELTGGEKRFVWDMAGELVDENGVKMTTLYTPHQTPRKRAPTRPRSGDVVGAPGRLGLTQANQAVRLMAGRFVPSPDAWRSAFLQSLAYFAVRQRAELAYAHGRPLPDTGEGFPLGAVIITPDGARPSRADLERPELEQRVGAGAGTQAVHAAEAERANSLMDEFGDEIGSQPMSSILGNFRVKAGADQARQQIAELVRMSDEGLKREPRWLTRQDYRRLMGDLDKANPILRRLYDNPTSFWRSLTLTYRPAWIVNNIVGQSFLYAINNFGPGGAKAYARSVLEQLKETAGIERKYATTEGLTYGHILAEGTQGEFTSGGPGALRVESRNAVTVALDGERAIRHRIQRFSAALSDEIPRNAAWYRIADQHRKRLNDINGTNTKLKEFLDDLVETSAMAPGKKRTAAQEKLKTTHDDVTRKVLDQLVDFDNLDPLERQVLRRIIPFYSWFKGITLATARFGFEHPDKALVLSILGQMELNDLRAEVGKEEATLWEAMIRRGDKEGLTLSLITRALNPIHTVADLIDGIPGLFGEEASPVDNLFFQANPLLQSAVEALSDRDLFTRQEIPGGALESAGRAVIGQFPQASTFDRATQTAERGEKFTQPGEKVRLPGTDVRVQQEVLQYLGIPLSWKSEKAAKRIAKTKRRAERTWQQNMRKDQRDERRQWKGKHNRSRRTKGEDIPKPIRQAMYRKEQWDRRYEKIQRRIADETEKPRQALEDREKFDELVTFASREGWITDTVARQLRQLGSASDHHLKNANRVLMERIGFTRLTTWKTKVDKTLGIRTSQRQIREGTGAGS